MHIAHEKYRFEIYIASHLHISKVTRLINYLPGGERTAKQTKWGNPKPNELHETYHYWNEWSKNIIASAGKMQASLSNRNTSWLSKEISEILQYAKQEK